jgi:general secretion pathway protein G
MHRAVAAVVLFTLLSAAVGCSHREQLRKEASLRESLVVLRSEITQFTLDLQRPPASLSELVASGYLKRIPPDPFTGKNDTWRTQMSSDDKQLEVHSGSDAISGDGTKYSSW